ncbi:acyl-CoA dehydrogenase family protein [Agitococcus lubricus]|uniref:Acyl-[acyl-carrier-protein] dehydrogenase MbtN n=1 Tax=Agitococcus lubricus TaxID=1077255 RepID=A0A2T5IY39_9GAMM|nr:acyl-CoA dehydrogenase family protein [Agitococcus lubricus]PTQ88896.1 acyl-CoA dehydrogenase [Agitococcus lubricus]
MSEYNSELEQFRDMVRRFLDKEIKPFYEQWEKDGIMPREIWHKLGENGLLCVDQPEEYNGIGASYLYACVILEEVSRANFGSLATALSVNCNIAAPYVLHIANEAQRQYWLPKMVTGDVVGAIGMTEPGAGSDLQAIRTTAIRKDDHYLLNGSKTFISNGQHADLVILAAKTDPAGGAKGVSLFLVDMKLAGCARGRNLDKMGLHSQDTSELFFDNVKLPLDSLLGEEGKGFAYLMNELPRERLNLAVCAVASSEGLLASTIAYTQERKAFGHPISKLQNTRFSLATCHTDIAINKAFTEQCIRQYMEGKLDASTAAIAKLATTEMQCRVADACLQLFGGYGYMMEYPAARAYVDARIQRIYGGTNEIMKEVIARTLVGR